MLFLRVPCDNTLPQHPLLTVKSPTVAPLNLAGPGPGRFGGSRVYPCAFPPPPPHDSCHLQVHTDHDVFPPPPPPL